MKNGVARILFVAGGAIIGIALVYGFVLGAQGDVLDKAFNWTGMLTSWGTGAISGLLFISIGELINVGQRILNAVAPIADVKNADVADVLETAPFEGPARDCRVCNESFPADPIKCPRCGTEQ